MGTCHGSTAHHHMRLVCDLVLFVINRWSLDTFVVYHKADSVIASVLENILHQTGPSDQCVVMPYIKGALVTTTKIETLYHIGSIVCGAYGNIRIATVDVHRTTNGTHLFHR
jgi:hypothetical protein